MLDEMKGGIILIILAIALMFISLMDLTAIACHLCEGWEFFNPICQTNLALCIVNLSLMILMLRLMAVIMFIVGIVLLIWR